MIELLIPFGIGILISGIKITAEMKVENQYKREQHEQKESDDFVIFWEKIEKETLPLKLITKKENPTYRIYEGFYKGYRVVITEREHQTEYWIDYKQKKPILNATYCEIEGRKKWKGTIKTENTSYIKYINHQFQKNMKNWEQKKWKNQVVSVSTSSCPELKKPLIWAEQHDEILAIEWKKLLLSYLALYTSDVVKEESEREKYFKKIPQTLQSMIKEYACLEKNYQMKEKENFIQYIQKTAKQYETKKQMKEEVFLAVRE